MGLSGTTEPQVISVESQQDERHQLLESAMSTVAAVKRFVANVDRLKEERDNFDSQLANAFAENEMLRKQVNDAKDHHDLLSQTVATLTDQMESIAARCKEAVTIVRAQLDTHAPATQADLRSTDDPSPAASTAVRSTLSAPDQLTDGRSADEQPTQPSTFEAGSGSISEASRVVHVFTQYLTQSTSADAHKTKSA
jgi:chromosome segregation ATPase